MTDQDEAPQGSVHPAPVHTAQPDAAQAEAVVALVRDAADAATARGAVDPVAIDVSSRLPLADAFLIVSGGNERNVLAIAEAIDERLADAGVPLKRREGSRQGRWELLDFGGLVVHVFHQEDRAYYGLERLWRDCPVISLPADVVSGRAAS